MEGVMKKARRTNLYFRKGHIFELLQVAARLKFFAAESASERIEELVTYELRRLAPKFRDARVILPEDVFAPKVYRRFWMKRVPFKAPVDGGTENDCASS